MSDDVIRRLSVEGVDPLTLAGVNDANLIELSKRLGVRVSLRGDTLTLQGKPEAVDHAVPITQALVDQLLSGLQLHDEPAPLAAQSCVQRGDHRLEIVLEQGKYHQVKRMLAAAGNHCAALHRSQIGGLTLESLGLREGEWCYLEKAQLDLLVPG